VGLGRVELPTNGLGNRCSIHLSYRPTNDLILSRVATIRRTFEPDSVSTAGDSLCSVAHEVYENVFEFRDIHLRLDTCGVQLRRRNQMVLPFRIIASVGAAVG
jgi:hypothetical protein